MQFWGAAHEVKKTEGANAIVFVVTRQRRWIDVLVIVGSAVAGYFAFWDGSHWVVLGFGAFGAIWLYRLVVLSSFELRASSWGLEVKREGSAGGSGSWAARWTEISGLEYAAGGEGDPTGLYVRQGPGGSVCVIADLDRDQVYGMVDTIYRRFPLVPMAEDGPGMGSIFGSGSDPISLGLSSKD